MSIRRGPFTAATVIVLAAIALITFAVVRSSGGFGASSVFESAKTACAEESPHISLLDDGRGLSVSGEGNDAAGASITEIVCVLGELSVPDAVLTRMGRTRALDGTQDASWSGMRASWTYHPDAGLNIVLEQDT